MISLSEQLDALQLILNKLDGLDKGQQALAQSQKELAQTQAELAKGQKNIEGRLMRLEDDVKEVKQAISRVEVGQQQDVLAILKRVDKNIENRTDVLNKRTFDLETKFEEFRKQ